MERRRTGRRVRTLRGIVAACARQLRTELRGHAVRVEDDLVAAFAFDVRYESYSARIFFIRGIIESVLARKAIGIVN